jgi:hypothetical protein
VSESESEVHGDNGLTAPYVLGYEPVNWSEGDEMRKPCSKFDFSDINKLHIMQGIVNSFVLQLHSLEII